MGSKRVADMTPEERERKRAYNRTWARNRYRKTTPEEKTGILAAAGARRRSRWESASPEEREHLRARRREYKREWARNRRAVLTEKEREQLRVCQRAYDTKRRLYHNKQALLRYYNDRDARRRSRRAWYAALPEPRRRALVAGWEARQGKTLRNSAEKYRDRRLGALFDAAVRLAAAVPAT